MSEILEIIPLDEEDPSIDEANGVLEAAKKANLSFAIIIGQTEDGEWYYASNENDRYRISFAVDMFKSFIMDIG